MRKEQLLRFSSHTNLLEAALAYAANGYSVVACEPCGKHPMLRERDDPPVSSRDPEVIKAWWAHWPNANIGLITGETFWVLDIDGERGARALYLASRSYRCQYNTTRVDSGNGHHLYYGLASGLRMPPTTVGLLPGVDVRGVDGMIIVPPSAHAFGKLYRPHLDVEEFQPAPAWLYELAMLADPQSTHVSSSKKIIPASGFQYDPSLDPNQ